MLLLCISLLFMILPEKFTQSIQCFYQYFCLILIKLRKHSFCHLSVKFRMMVICHTSLVGKLDKYHSPVLAAMEDIFPPPRPTASIMCISLLEISLYLSVMMASSSSRRISLNRFTSTSFITSRLSTLPAPVSPEQKGFSGSLFMKPS